MGGIAGTNLSSGTINNCTTTGSVYGAHFIGGIVGENHGAVINCGNDANVNTTIDQNEVDLSELTLNDLIGTENAADITDIGGIAGTSSGVVRACLNHGTVGYLHIGYNIGGIVGSQTGYVEGCVNYGPVYARKEGGGIVGQMEPSSTLLYSQDTLQELGGELETLQTLVNRACDDAQRGRQQPEQPAQRPAKPHHRCPQRRGHPAGPDQKRCFAKHPDHQDRPERPDQRQPFRL